MEGKCVVARRDEGPCSSPECLVSARRISIPSHPDPNDISLLSNTHQRWALPMPLPMSTPLVPLLSITATQPSGRNAGLLGAAEGRGTRAQEQEC